VKLVKYLFLFLCLATCACSAQETLASPTILSFAQNQLPHWGILKQSEGFVYVKVDDAYIHKLITFIQKEGFREPPYFVPPRGSGAHITVIYPREAAQYGVGEIQECAERIYFRVKACKVVHPSHWQEFDEVFCIVVDAPQLDRMREKYGLPKRLYDFHITVGVKRKEARGGIGGFSNVMVGHHYSVRAFLKNSSLFLVITIPATTAKSAVAMHFVNCSV
jgi:hypothetical protein